MEFLQWLNDNAGAVQAISTFALVVVTIYYAVTSRKTAKLLETLPVVEEKVVRMRYGIGFDHEHTLAEIGHEFNLTRERIRQIEAKAMEELREPHRAWLLRQLLDCRS